MGDIFGDAKISNTFWMLEISNIFWRVGGGVNGKCWTRAYV